MKDAMWRNPRKSAARMAVVLALAAVSAAAVPGQSSAGRPEREARYHILSRGFRVGELKTVMQPRSMDGKSLVRFEASTSIDASFIFFSVKSKSREEALISESGTVSYTRHATENGRTRDVTAHFAPAMVRIEINENGQLKRVEIPRDRFDFTTMDCPETTMPREGSKVEIRLLDLENARVVNRRYTWVRNETITIGDRSIRCRVVDFEDPDNSCRRWIARDELGVIIAKQEGKGKTGSYTLRMERLDG